MSAPYARSVTWGLRQIDEEQRARYRAEGWWGDETLGQHLYARLTAHPDLPFVVHSATRPWRGTFAGIAELAARVAGGLAARGVGPGDVVSFQTPNWVEGAATFYGAAMAGAVIAPVVHIYGVHELSYILGSCHPKVHVAAVKFGQQDYLANLATIGDLGDTEVIVIGGDPDGRHGSFDELVSGPPIEGPVAADPASPSVVGWTSGTTSNPKGVVHSHQTALAEVKQMSIRRAPTKGPLVMANPISHAIGMLGGLLMPLEAGDGVHLLDQWDPGRVLELMLAENLRAGGGVPYFLTSLLDHPSFTEKHLELLKYQGMGGAPIPAAFADRVTALGIICFRAYGSTEHPSMTTSAYDDPAEKRLWTDGAPAAGTEVRLIDEDGKDVGPGVPGEILSRGAELFMGYTDPALTAQVFDDDGWYHSGDIGVRDEEGYITITDRISDIIIRGGENISAAEIEELLMRMPGISEVAVVAAPDARLGEHAAAVIRVGPGGSAPPLDAIRTHLESAGLARQKWPEEVVVVEDFPRTASGKIQKFKLRQTLRDRG
jgi:acyl-CoA synthetase